jgi:hypothetical protein
MSNQSDKFKKWKKLLLWIPCGLGVYSLGWAGMAFYLKRKVVADVASLRQMPLTRILPAFAANSRSPWLGALENKVLGDYFKEVSAREVSVEGFPGVPILHCFPKAIDAGLKAEVKAWVNLERWGWLNGSLKIDLDHQGGIIGAVLVDFQTPLSSFFLKKAPQLQPLVARFEGRYPPLSMMMQGGLALHPKTHDGAFSLRSDTLDLNVEYLKRDDSFQFKALDGKDTLLSLTGWNRRVPQGDYSVAQEYRYFFNLSFLKILEKAVHWIDVDKSSLVLGFLGQELLTELRSSSLVRSMREFLPALCQIFPIEVQVSGGCDLKQGDSLPKLQVSLKKTLLELVRWGAQHPDFKGGYVIKSSIKNQNPCQIKVEFRQKPSEQQNIFHVDMTSSLGALKGILEELSAQKILKHSTVELVQGLIKILNKEASGNDFSFSFSCEYSKDSVLATLINGKPWHSLLMDMFMLLKTY